MDLRFRLAMPAAEPDIGECIVVLETTGPGLGLLVSSVEGVVTMAADSLNQSRRSDESRIAGRVLEAAGHVVTVLDHDAAVGNEVRAYLEAVADTRPVLEEWAA
jgi:chemotaxis signal transduction protein